MSILLLRYLDTKSIAGPKEPGSKVLAPLSANPNISPHGKSSATIASFNYQVGASGYASLNLASTLF